MAGIVFAINLFFLPETHPAVLQAWKARQLRHLTSDNRYQAQSEISQVSFQQRVKHALTRPFVLGMEPIVIAISIYLTIIWTVLFIFLDGYPIIFQQTYKLSEGITNLLSWQCTLVCYVRFHLYMLFIALPRTIWRSTPPQKAVGNFEQRLVNTSLCWAEAGPFPSPCSGWHGPPIPAFPFGVP